MEGNRIVGAFQIGEQKSPILQAIFMQQLKEIVLPNYPLVLSVLKHRNVWVFWNKKKKIVLLNYPLGLSLLKYRNMWVFWNKKKSGSNRCSPLNSSIDIDK